VHVFQYNLTFPNGRLVDPCTGDGATPDPCVRRSFDSAQNDVVLTVFTTTASIWAFGTPLGSPDDCCTALNPQTVTFTFTGTGTCGILRSFRCAGDVNAACATDADCPLVTGPCAEVIGAGLPLDLECGALYFGGGFNSVPLPITLTGMTTASTDVTSCSATSGVLGLGATTAAATGSARTCTSGRECSGSAAPCVVDSDCPAVQTCDTQCVFGAPVPIPNAMTPPTSVCAVLDVQTDATGTATCNGDAALDLPLRMNVFLNGDLFRTTAPPNIPGAQPCPLCDTFCVGGTNNEFPCGANSDCNSGVCESSTRCLGGPNDGLPCTPGSSDSATLGDPEGAFPTSHDCPSEPSMSITDSIGGVLLDLALSTGSTVTNARDLNGGPGGNRVFCGFCRDSFGLGSLCFEGDTDGVCPVAVPPATGNAVPCSTDADCADADEYESCAQRSPGAFSEGGATHISLTGKPAPPSLGGDSRLVTSFCIPPTYDSVVDAAADWPGPGAVMLLGEVSVSP
jgi:hypothetical protein